MSALLANTAGALAGDRIPPGFVEAAAVVPGLVTDIRYAGAHNFTGVPVDGYEAPICWLTREAADALAKVQIDLRPHGLGLLAFDCYRPERAVRRFVQWAATPGEDAGKAEFYPDVDKQDLFKRGYIAARSSHSRGSTVDLTLVHLATGQSLDMGTPFDLFGPKSHTDFSGLPKEVRAHRDLLRDAMIRRGFTPYAQEWWHFTLKSEPLPTTSFDVPIRDDGRSDR